MKGATKASNLSEQWIGRSIADGGEPAFAMVNIESRSPGTALAAGVEPRFQLRTVSQATIKIQGDRVSGETYDYNVFDPSADAFVPFPVFYERSGVRDKPPSSAKYSGKITNNRVAGRWKNDLGKEGSFEYARSFAEALAGTPTAKPEVMGPFTWEQYKQHVAKFRLHGHILFRGQHSNAYPLRTTFHRANRNNLFRYLREDVTRLRHHINAISTHNYLPGGEDLLGLLGLAQHHGFPTPLLDWTASPYVAAFFAFDCLTGKVKWLEKKDRLAVRVFTFDLQRWRTVQRVWAHSLNDPWPDFQFFHPPAHNNPRYYPQQSIVAFSNVDDIEGFVGHLESLHKVKYLTRIDIRADQRELVEDELRFMGITAATLFPGFEGICKALHSELF